MLRIDAAFYATTLFPSLIFSYYYSIKIHWDVVFPWKRNFYTSSLHFGAVLHLLLLNGESGELGLVRLTSATVIYLYSFSNRVNEAIPTIS